MSQPEALYFDFWGELAMTWHEPRWSIAPDFAIKFGYFMMDKPTDSPGALRLDIYAHPPPGSVTDGLKPVAERCEANDSVMRLEHQHGRMRFTSWIQDLHTDHVKLYYHFPFLRRLQWPWPLIPDHLIGMHLVQPMVEFLLSRRGIWFLHAGAAARDGGALLLPGRGSTFKTTCLIKLLEAGWSFLADDLVALRPGEEAKPAELLAYPIGARFFDYFYRKAGDESVTLPRMVAALRHINRGGPLGFDIAPPSRIQAVNLLMRWSDTQTRTINRGIVDDAMIDRVLAVNQLERLTFVDIDEAFGRFMFHHDQVRGSSLWESFWRGQRSAMSGGLLGLPCAEIGVGRSVSVSDLVLPDQAAGSMISPL